jgi:hypothetical protein
MADQVVLRATTEQRMELARALEQLAVRVRTSEVRDYTLDVENGVREVVWDEEGYVGAYRTMKRDGSMRVAITVQF